MSFKYTCSIIYTVSNLFTGSIKPSHVQAYLCIFQSRQKHTKIKSNQSIKKYEQSLKQFKTEY